MPDSVQELVYIPCVRSSVQDEPCSAAGKLLVLLSQPDGSQVSSSQFTLQPTAASLGQAVVQSSYLVELPLYVSQAIGEVNITMPARTSAPVLATAKSLLAGLRARALLSATNCTVSPSLSAPRAAGVHMMSGCIVVNAGPGLAEPVTALSGTVSIWARSSSLLSANSVVMHQGNGWSGDMQRQTVGQERWWVRAARQSPVVRVALSPASTPPTEAFADTAGSLLLAFSAAEQNLPDSEPTCTQGELELQDALLPVTILRHSAPTTLQVQLQVVGTTNKTWSDPLITLQRHIGEQTGQAPCTFLQWVDFPRAMLCSVPGSLGTFTSMQVTAFGQNISSVIQAGAATSPTLASVWPSTITPADWDGSSRQIQARVSGFNFGQQRSDIADVYIGSVRCASVARLSDTALMCSVSASAFAGMSGQLSVNVHLAPSVRADVSAAGRTATVASAVQLVPDVQAPAGSLPASTVSARLASTAALGSVLYDDVTLTNDIRVKLRRILAVPAALQGDFALPNVGQELIASSVQVTGTASTAGQLQLFMDIIDDAGNQRQDVWTVHVENTVPGDMIPAPNMTEGLTPPFPSRQDLLCVRVTFDRPVTGLNASDLVVSAAFQNGSALGWQPGPATLITTSAQDYQLCIGAADAPEQAGIALSLAQGAAHDASDGNIESAALGPLQFVRDTQAPTFVGPLCAQNKLWAARVPVACVLQGYGWTDSSTASADLAVLDVQVSGLPGSVASSSSLPSLFGEAGIALSGDILAAGTAHVMIRVADAAGNAANLSLAVSVADPALFPPAVHQVSPAELPHAGGQVVIVGENFTPFLPTVINVTLGELPGQLCAAVEMLNASALTCTAPAGVGNHQLVRVYGAAGAVSPAVPLLSYAPPGIVSTSASPFAALALANGTADVSGLASLTAQYLRVTCTGCGSTRADITGLSIGGWACPSTSIARSSGSVITCLLNPSAALDLVTAEGAPATLESSSVWAAVVLEVAGQASSPSKVAIVGAPRVTSVLLPATTDGHRLVSGGTSVTLQGENFGRVAQEIQDVTVGGVSALSVNFVSSTSLALVVPPGAGELVPIVVHMRTGMRSQVRPAAAVTYRASYNAARPPLSSTTNVQVSRVARAPANWAVSVQVPNDMHLQLLPPLALAFRWMRADGSTAAGADDAGTWSEPLELGTNQLNVTQVGSTWHITGTLADSRLPAYAAALQAAVVNAGGVGPWPSVHTLQSAVPAALPSVGVLRVHGSRSPGASSEVLVQLDVKAEPALEAMPPTLFQARYATVGSGPAVLVSARAGNRQRGLQSAAYGEQTVPVTAAVLQRVENGSVWRYQFKLSQMPAAPVLLAVDISTAAGTMAASQVSSPVYEACLATHFLQTHLRGDQVVCAPCPRAAWCGGGNYSMIMPLEGWQRLRHTQYALHFTQCAVVEACPGVPPSIAAAALTSNDLATARSVSIQYSSALASYQVVGAQATVDVGSSVGCAKGYTGIACRSCAIGYAQSPDTGECTQCGPVLMTYLFLGLGFLALVGVMGYLIMSTIRTGLQEQAQIESGLRKLFIGHIQQVSLASGFAFKWPVAVNWMLRSMGTVGSANDRLMSTDCLVQSHEFSAFRMKMLAILGAPWAVGVVVTVTWLLVLIIAKWCCRKPTPASASPGPLSRASLAQGRVVKNYWVLSLVVVCFTLHTSLTSACLRLLHCVEVPGDESGLRVLADDYNVVCSSDDNVGWMYGLGLSAFLAYGVGMPAGLYLILRRHREQLGVATIQHRYGFLYASYTRDAWWYEMFMMLRRAVLGVTIMILASAGVALQAYAAILVLFAALVAHMNIRPMVNARLQWLEQGSLIISVLTLLGGLFLETGVGSDLSQITVSVLIVGSNGGLLGYVALQLVLAFASSVPWLWKCMPRCARRHWSRVYQRDPSATWTRAPAARAGPGLSMGELHAERNKTSRSVVAAPGAARAPARHGKPKQSALTAAWQDHLWLDDSRSSLDDTGSGMAIDDAVEVSAVSPAGQALAAPQRRHAPRQLGARHGYHSGLWRQGVA